VWRIPVFWDVTLCCWVGASWLKDCSTFIFHGQIVQEEYLDHFIVCGLFNRPRWSYCLSLKYGNCSPNSVHTTCPTPQHHITHHSPNTSHHSHLSPNTSHHSHLSPNTTPSHHTPLTQHITHTSHPTHHITHTSHPTHHITHTFHPTPQHHIPAFLNSQQCHCENLKSCL
jgi:hypothetical protein